MTAEELAKEAKRKKPDVRYASASNGNFVGVFDKKLDKFIAIAAKLPGGMWTPLEPFMSRNDGFTIAGTWLEVSAEDAVVAPGAAQT